MDLLSNEQVCVGLTERRSKAKHSRRSAMQKGQPTPDAHYAGGDIDARNELARRIHAEKVCLPERAIHGYPSAAATLYSLAIGNAGGL